MAHLHRRTILLAGIVPLALAACGTVNGGKPTVSDLASSVALTAGGLAAVVASLSGVPNVSPQTISVMQGFLTTLSSDASALATQSAGSTAAFTVQDIVATASKIALIAMPLIPGGSPFIPVLNAAMAMLPVLLQEAGVKSVSLRASPKMTEAKAREILAPYSKS